MNKSIERRITELSPTKRAVLLRRLQRLVGDADNNKITPRGRDSNIFPLSFSQQRLWFLDQLEPGNPTFNVPLAVRLSQTLNEEAFVRSLNAVVARHEVLRSNFVIREGHPVQVIAAALPVPFIIEDLRNLSAEAREARVNALALEEAQYRFDLAQGSLLRARLLRIGAAEYVFLLTLHHIISDGWSMGLLLDELVTYYRGFCNGQAVKLPALGVQYADYATWQREWMSGTVQARQLAYWKKQLQDAPSLLKVPLDHPRREVEQFRGATVYFKLPAPLTQRLKEVSREQNITLYMLLLSAYQILLYRISGQRDILVGTPVAGRNKAETEDLIGFFVNTLVMRTHFSGRETFKELLLQVRKTALEAYANQDLPFEKLVEALQPERSLSYSPIFQVMFTFFNEPTRRKLRDTGFEWSALEIDRGLSNRDLTLRMEELDNVLVGHLEYNVDLFENSTIRRFIAQFERLLVQLMEHPDDRIANLDLLSEEEKQAITKAGQTQEKSSRDKFKQFLGKRPGGLNLSQPELVKIGSLSPDMTFPLLVQPRVTEVSLVTWAEKNLEFIQTNLDKYGAILWRNFPVSGPTEFEQFARIIAPELLDYMERSTPRNLVEGKVFTSTSYPPDQYIMLHNEVSYSHCWPIKLWFYCQHAPSQGGATPLADSRLVYQRLDPALKEKFISKRVMYVRNYGDGLDLPWQEVYQTNHPAEVEKYCRDAGIEFEWKSGNRLRTRQVRQAVAQHPRTGEMVWFNSVHMFHVAAHTPEVRDSLLAIFAPEDLPRNVYFGDGTPIENDEIAHIRQTYRECTISFPWQTGDVMLVDNMLLAHGRTPFSGERKVLVAMAEPYSQ